MGIRFEIGALTLATASCGPCMAFGTFKLTTVKQCTLGAGGPEVTLLRTHRIGDTFEYHIRLSGQPTRPIFTGNNDEARGTLIKATCAGTKPAHAMVISGEFMGSGYPMGVAYAWNPSLQHVERIDFAERAFPSRVQLSPSGMQLLIPNHGGETSARFILYQHDAATDKTEVINTDTLPEANGPVIRID